jgi:16S rRNA (guanine527-N7)-methyltransferase
VTILNKRAEEIEKEQREAFDLVTSRAVAPLPILLEISVPYCKVNGIIIEPKGKNYLDEYKYTNKLVGMLGVKLLPIKKTANGVIIIGLKTKKTPTIYPRRYKDIVKEYERG